VRIGVILKCPASALYSPSLARCALNLKLELNAAPQSQRSRFAAEDLRGSILTLTTSAGTKGAAGVQVQWSSSSAASKPTRISDPTCPARSAV
jgi:hypothetical protein